MDKGGGGAAYAIFRADLRIVATPYRFESVTVHPTTCATLSVQNRWLHCKDRITVQDTPGGQDHDGECRTSSLVF